MSNKTTRLLALIICIIIFVIYYEYKNVSYYRNIPICNIDEYLRTAKTGDILFTKWNYVRPKIKYDLYTLNLIQTITTKIPFSHIAVLIRYSDIPQQYRDLWNLKEEKDKVYVYSSEGKENFDLITKKIKEGNSLRCAEDYMKKYNGIITCMSVLDNSLINDGNITNVCEYMHKHRNRLFNRNFLRYFNLKPKIWENTYNPAKALCVETCYDFLKKLALYDVAGIS